MMSDFGFEMPGLGLLANVDTIKKRPDDLRKFLKVTFRAALKHALRQVLFFGRRQFRR